MTIEQTIEVPANHWITVEVPPEIPAGAIASLDFICPPRAHTVNHAAHRTPISQYFGILSPDTYGDGVAYQREIRNEWND
jgi:hypothetical protein